MGLRQILDLELGLRNPTLLKSGLKITWELAQFELEMQLKNPYPGNINHLLTLIKIGPMNSANHMFTLFSYHRVCNKRFDSW